MDDVPVRIRRTGVCYSCYIPEVTTTTSTQFQTKMELETPDLVAGEYQFYLSYGWNVNSTNRSIEVRFQGDLGSGFEDLMELHRQEPKDASGLFGGTGSSQRMYLTRTFNTTLESGTYQWRLQFRSERRRTEVSIWEVFFRLEAM